MREKCDNGYLGLGKLNQCCGRNVSAQFVLAFLLSAGLSCDPGMNKCVTEQTSAGTFHTRTRKLGMHGCEEKIKMQTS